MVFVGIMAVGQFSPGPDMVLLTRTSLAEGRKAGCWTAIGIASGLGLHATIAVAGVASLLAQGGLVEMVIRCLAAVYLTWLAFLLIRSAMRASEVDFAPVKQISTGSRLGYWKRGFLCNLLNPKVAVFLAGVTAPFLVNHSGWKWPLVLWCTIVFEGALLWCLWVCLLQQPTVKKTYQRKAKWFDLVFGVVLFLIAVILVWGFFA